MGGITRVTEEEIDFGAEQLTKLKLGFYYTKKGRKTDFTRQYARQLIYLAKLQGLDYKKLDYSDWENIKEK